MANHAREDEPLLGRATDALKAQKNSVSSNLWTGGAPLTQAGILSLNILFGVAIGRQELMLFSAHPLLNSTGMLFLTQAILILQPTHTADEKRKGTLYHAAFNFTALSALIGGLVVIEVNKFGHGGTHFVSYHARLGLGTYMLLGVQTIVGFTQYWTPRLYGGRDRAKSIWKYHRMSGYVVLVMSLATMCAATQTDFNLNSLHVQLGAVVISSCLILTGILSRVQKYKFGF